MLPYLLTQIDTDNYQTYLKEKTTLAISLLQNNNLVIPTAQIYPSKSANFRDRCEYDVFFNDDKSFDYIMYQKKDKEKQRIIINQNPQVSKHINLLMQDLKENLISYPQLCHKLFEIDFLANSTGNIIATLHYHKKLDENWLDEAIELKKKILSTNKYQSVDFVGRSRGIKFCTGSDYIFQAIDYQEKTLLLKQIEGTFTQPNNSTCRHMINFALSCLENHEQDDLIELYCGSGTFTLPMSFKCRKIFATELSRIPTANALDNLRTNNINNVAIARLSAQEVCEALNNKREFYRLKSQNINLKDYNFKTVFIDPPREGLVSDSAREFISGFDNIIYISCGLESLAEDLKYFSSSHDIKKLAFFDQFAYTKHLESGVFLQRKA